MKILLTDEELAFSFNGWAAVTLTQRREIAQAQLKQMVDLLAENITYRGGKYIRFRLTQEQWQALIKEAGL